MGRRILWDAIDIDGQRIINHYLPEDIVESRNEQQMRIRLINGSQIQILGSDDVDKSLVGTNAVGIVFSEYALQDPHAWQLSIPILKASAGWALFVSTVRGRNHFYDLYEVVKDRDDWFCELLTIEDTKHITVAEIEKEIESGQISRDLAMQEFWNDFNLGVEGSFYGKYIDDLRKKNQITQVMWEPYLPVHTAWDLGYNDSTTIVFFQVSGPSIRIIDYYENNKQGLEHYAKVVKDKQYTYGKHIAPHDIAVHDLSTGVSRWKMMHDLGITFVRVEGKLPSIDDGIEAVRRILPRCWFDDKSCGKLIKYLENYRQEYDNKRKVYKSTPLHDINSHACFTADTKLLTHNGMRSIVDINDDDLILTSSGWQKCTKSIVTKRSADIVQIVFQCGMIVKCTPDHLFKTVNGWKSAKNLTRDTEIQSSLMIVFGTLMDLCIEYIQKSDIFLMDQEGFIDVYGRKLLEKYQKVVTYTIETIIPMTIDCLILSVYQKKIILNWLDQITKDLDKKLEMLQQNGIDLKKEFYGIRDMLYGQLDGLNGKESQENVSIVENNLIALLEKMETNKNIVTQIVKPLLIESVTYLDKTEDVWDIYVDVYHEFSLSNGAIVHNCDAFRYLALALPKLTANSSPEELDKRYKSAVYGANSIDTGFFSDFKGY
jgi:phage terminase large subunit